MSLINFSKIVNGIDKFVIDVVNLFCSDKVYSYEFARRTIINELMSNQDNFVDYHSNLEYIISKLIFCVQNGDTIEFVNFIMCISHLNEVTLRLDEINDVEKIDSITKLVGKLYEIIECCIEN